jgi:hypothetical protein
MDWEIKYQCNSWMHSVNSMCAAQLRSTLGVVRITETGFGVKFCDKTVANTEWLKSE